MGKTMLPLVLMVRRVSEIVGEYLISFNRAPKESIVCGPELNLANIEDIVNLEVGMTIVSLNRDTGTFSTGYFERLPVNDKTYTLTYSGWVRN